MNPLVSELGQTWTNLESLKTEPRPTHRAPDGPDDPAHRTKTALLDHDGRHRLLDDHRLPHNGHALLDHDGAGVDESAAEPTGLSGRGSGERKQGQGGECESDWTHGVNSSRRCTKSGTGSGTQTMQIDLHKATRFQRRSDGTWRVETPHKSVIVTDPRTIKFVEAYIEARIEIQTRDNPDGHGITVSDLPG